MLLLIQASMRSPPSCLFLLFAAYRPELHEREHLNSSQCRNSIGPAGLDTRKVILNALK